MKKKVLSVLLTLAMVLTLVTTVAFADAVSGNITSEVTAAQEWGENTTVNESVTLKSTESAFTITLSKEIDFGANTLTVTASDEQAVTISGGFTLKVNTVNVTAGKLILAESAKISGSIILSNGAKLSLNSNDYEAVGSATVTCTDGTTVKLTNGKVKVPSGQAITIGDKTYTADSAPMTISSDTELSEGAVTLTGGASVKVNGKVISGNSVKVSVSGGTATITGDSQTATIDDKTYKLGSSASLTYNGSEVTITTGTVELGNEAVVKLDSDGKAKVGESQEISGANVVVGYSGANEAKITSTAAATIGGKTYTPGASSELTVGQTDVTLAKGSVTLGDAETTVKVGRDPKEVKGKVTVTKTDDTNFTVSASEAGAVEIAGKSYTAGESMTATCNGTDVTLTSGSVTLSSDTIKATGGKVTASNKEFEVTAGEVTITSGGQASGSTGASVTVENVTYAANATKLDVTITGSGITVTDAKVTGLTNQEVTAGSSKKYTAVTSAGITVTSGAVTLDSGSIKTNDGTVTVGGKQYEVGTAEVTFTTSNVKAVTTATVKVDSKTYTAGSSGATFTYTDSASLSAGSVTLDGTADATVGGVKVSGNGIEVSSDGVVTIASGKTATVGGTDTFAAETQGAKVKPSSSGVEVTEITSGGTLKVTDNDSSLNVKYGNITFKGDEYTLSDNSGAKVDLGSGKTVTATFSGNETLEVSGGTLKAGTETVSGGKLTGAAGASIKLTQSGSDITAEGTKGEEISAEGKITAKPGSTSSPSSGSSTPSTTVDKPTTDAASGETKVDVNTNSTTSGTTAKATVTGTNMDKAVNSAVDEAKKQGTAPVVEVEVKTSAKADTLNVTLPAASLEKLAEAEDASLVITSDIAEVALDNTALTALADQATGNTVTLEVAPVADSALNEAQAEAVGEADVVDLSLVSNGVVIHDYNNGKITVTLPYKLAAGKDPASVQVYFLDDDGSLTPCATSYDSKTAKVTFTTVHLSKYVIGDETLAEQPGEEECPSDQFTDLDPDKWYHEGVDYAIANGLMNGTGADTFSPDAATNRAMVVTILYRLEGEPAVSKDIPFADVPAGQWYSNAITWAAANGIVTGYSETEFGPDDTITREQMAAILYRYAGYKGYDVSGAADLTGYTDAASVSSWAAEAVRWAVAEGLIEGTGAGTLSPAGDSTRAQAATILMRFCEGVAK